MTFQDKAKKIDTIIMDVDGVLTDGKLICSPEGDIWRNMNAKDGFALQAALKGGMRLAIITSGRQHGVLKKLEAFGVQLIYENVWEKKQQVLDFAKEHDCDLSKALFLGDDLPDHPAMLACGVRACPADAVADIRAISDYVSPLGGGKGCVRDILERVLKIQDKWKIPT